MDCQRELFDAGITRHRTPKPVRRARGRPATVLTVRGVERTIHEWAALAGISVYTIHHRLQRGWSPADAVGLSPLPTGTYLGKKS